MNVLKKNTENTEKKLSEESSPRKTTKVKSIILKKKIKQIPKEKINSKLNLVENSQPLVEHMEDVSKPIINVPTLIIVESPNKVKTIGSFFNVADKVKVMATVGHIKIIESKSGSIAFKKDNVHFDWMIKRADLAVQIMNAVNTCTEILLASDFDREGEAIAWEVYTMILDKFGKDHNKIIKRITFTEITKKSIYKAMHNKRNIDFNLVNAYLSRVAIDFDCGFSISQIMWRKLRCGYSAAGRVQSPTLDLVVQREKEIRKFKSKYYYSIHGAFSHNNILYDQWELTQIKGKKYNNTTITQEEDAKLICEELENEKDFHIFNYEIKSTKSSPSTPLYTSFLQQLANSNYGFDGKTTMRIAQGLYEGLQIQGKQVGLITYMRTDSFFINLEFLHEMRDYIKNQYGDIYLNKDIRVYKKKIKNTQESHEAIRPTKLQYDPESIKEYLTNDQYKLYSLIWNYTLASQMPDAQYKILSIFLKTKDEKSLNKDTIWKKSYKALVFQGYSTLMAYGHREDLITSTELDTKIETIQTIIGSHEHNLFKIHEIHYKNHKTNPLPRFTHGSLLQAMEEIGIGRPSTYANIVDALLKYQYCVKQGNSFLLQPKGAAVSNFLQKFFKSYLQAEFTSKMEDTLDAIANGNEEWLNATLKFHEELVNSVDTVNKVPMKNILDSITPSSFEVFNHSGLCPQCSGSLLLLSKLSLFIKCSQCEYTAPLFAMEPDYKEISLDANISIKKGQSFWYIQEKLEDKTSKNYPIPKSMKIEEIDVNKARWIMSMPLIIGQFLEKDITLHIGKKIDYLSYDGNFYSVKESIDQITLEKAISIIEATPPKKKFVKSLKKTSNNGAKKIKTKKVISKRSKTV